jgi:hypothetical protein
MMKRIVIASLALVAALQAFGATPTIPTGPAANDATTVDSVRKASTVAAFRKQYACPATGKKSGACPGWVVDHGIPLCAGGQDKVYNMHWQLKAESYLKDADERRLCAAIAKMTKG